MKRRAALVIGASLLVMWIAGRLLSMRSDAETPVPEPELTELAPYSPGMTLREAFETLPASADRTGLTLHLDNTQAWVARWRMLDAARESLDVSYFILREDLFGAAFLGHLLKKAKQGVKLRLLFDAQGTLMSFTSPRGNDWLDTLANTDAVRLKIFRPLVNRYVEAFFTLNPVALVASEHDKILVVDRRAGMIGGRNISAEYFADPADMPQAFEDVDITLIGKSAAQLLIAAFEVQFRRDDAYLNRRERLDLASYAEELTLAYLAMDAWLRDEPLHADVVERMQRIGASWREDLAKYPKLRGAWHRQPEGADAHAEIRLLDSRTRLERRDEVIGEALARLSQSSHEHILVQSPYLVLSQDAVKMLAAAGAKGTRITVLTNSPISSDNALSQAFFLEQWPELLARIPNLRIFVTGRTRTVHTKLAVFDGQVAVVGTYNLDPVSMQINSEVMAAAWSKTFSREIAAHPCALLAHGAPTVYEYRIERDAAGRALRDAEGKPIVAFGPRDHSDPEEWRKIQVYWKTLRAAGKIGGFAPIF